jgi:hypothetical protein
VKKFIIVCILFLMVGLLGCSTKLGSAGAGAVGGAAVGVGGYEYNLHKQKQRIEQDYKDGKIDRKEYEIRMDQLNRDSVFR